MDLTLTSEFDLGQEKPLTKQELAFLTLKLQGFVDEEIAQRWFISDKTVRTHQRNINAKLFGKKNFSRGFRLYHLIKAKNPELATELATKNLSTESEKVLTEEETRVLFLRCYDYTIREIAEKLGKPFGTVQTQSKSIPKLKPQSIGNNELAFGYYIAANFDKYHIFPEEQDIDKSTLLAFAHHLRSKNVEEEKIRSSIFKKYHAAENYDRPAFLTAYFNSIARELKGLHEKKSIQFSIEHIDSVKETRDLTEHIIDRLNVEETGITFEEIEEYLFPQIKERFSVLHAQPSMQCV